MKTPDSAFSTIRLRTIALMLLLLIPVLLIGRNKPDTISFIHITDTHFCNLAGYHPVIVQGRQHYGEVTDPLISFFRSVPEKLHSDFIVITGDMIDYYEGETALGDMLDTQVEQFARLLQKTHIPVYLTLGNHDIASYMVDPESGRGLSHQYHAGHARAAWIRNVPCFRNGTYHSLTFQVNTTTYRLIFLDNAYYAPGRPADVSFTMDPYQLYWLDNELKKSDTDIEIVFLHMPLINPEREDLAPTLNKYFLDPDDTVAIKHELKAPDKDTFDLFSVLRQNSSVRLVMSGHRHSSVTHEVHLSDDYSLTHLMTGAFGRDSRNWRQIQLTGSSIIISFPGDKRSQFVINLN
jgi:3',5'-cyclic AMP phosphodiesterase CpdA